MIRSSIERMNGIWVIVLCVCLAISGAPAFAEAPDIQTYLPLFERNSLGRKILDVHYSDDTSSVHLIFDAETGKYREERKFQINPDSYTLWVYMWDGKELVTLTSGMSNVSEPRSPGNKFLFEHPRTAVISEISHRSPPPLLTYFYDARAHPISKTVLDENPKLGAVSGDTITIETNTRKYEFSQKTCALKRIEYYLTSNGNRRMMYCSYDLSDHVECSGVLIPLRIVNIYIPSNAPQLKTEYSMDPKTLRLLDKVDVTLFHEPLPLGCLVTDKIRKRNYTVTTPGTNPPQDVEALQKMLEKMLEQAEEQKAAAKQKNEGSNTPLKAGEKIY